MPYMDAMGMSIKNTWKLLDTFDAGCRRSRAAELGLGSSAQPPEIPNKTVGGEGKGRCGREKSTLQVFR